MYVWEATGISHGFVMLLWGPMMIAPFFEERGCDEFGDGRSRPPKLYHNARMIMEKQWLLESLLCCGGQQQAQKGSFRSSFPVHGCPAKTENGKQPNKRINTMLRSGLMVVRPTVSQKRFGKVVSMFPCSSVRKSIICDKADGASFFSVRR